MFKGTIEQSAVVSHHGAGTRQRGQAQEIWCLIMDICLLRHGIAADVGGKVKNDSERPLTSEGIAAMEEEARGLRKLDIQFDAILTSPLVRARQTAEIVAEFLHDEDKLDVCEALGIPGSMPGVLKALRNYDMTTSILLVGHQPDLGKLAGHLIGIDKLWLPFKKGGLCRLEVERLHPTPYGELRWFLTPKQVKWIGDT